MILGASCGGWSCGGLGGQPPDRPPVVQAPDGQSYYLIAKGPYKAFYDGWGRLDRIEYDQKGTGKPDRIARYDGLKHAHRLEIDFDFDGHMDRYEDYDPEGHLIRFATIGSSGKPDRWTVVGPKGETLRYEYDPKDNGHPERIEYIEGDRIVRVELDSDHDGRIDRWQQWENGRLVSESIDTNGDGKPHRRVFYTREGAIDHVERLSP
jgi:hypothetical protein